MGLGSERLKRQIGTQFNRQVEPANRGNNKKSEKFREETKDQTF